MAQCGAMELGAKMSLTTTPTPSRFRDWKDRSGKALRALEPVQSGLLLPIEGHGFPNDPFEGQVCRLMPL